MLLPFTLALVSIAFMAALGLLFFHVQKMEKRLAETLREVEGRLVATYGKIPPKRVKEASLEMDDQE